jgi:hypothetical protein
MASELIFVMAGDGRAEKILAAFADETGLTPETIGDGVRFELGREDHDVKVVQTLNDIDPDWSRFISLREPSGSGSRG